MRKMNIVVPGVGAIVVLAVGTGWRACGGWKALGIGFDDDTSSAVAITEIRVAGGMVGIEVRPGAASGVEIQSHLTLATR